jgi:Domain of unknown function (DUF4304)
MLPLESAIAPELKAAGFRKKGRTWWRERAEVIQVVNLQKSSFGDQLYINLGVYLKRLGTETAPPQNRCHIGVRCERIAKHRHMEIAAATSPGQPSENLVSAVLSDGVTWLESVSTLTGIKEYLAAGGASKGLVFASVRQLLTETHDG